MKLTKDNFTQYVPAKDHNLMMALLIDVDSLPRELEIHIVTEHTEYSPERVDPCPDYFGTYFIKWAGTNDVINNGFDINELDNHLCTLVMAFEQLYENE